MLLLFHLPFFWTPLSIPSLKRPPLREKVSLQEELAIETAPELPVLETVASQKVQEQKKDSYQLRQAMTQLSRWTPKLDEVNRGHPYVSCSCRVCVHACVCVCACMLVCVCVCVCVSMDTACLKYSSYMLSMGLCV